MEDIFLISVLIKPCIPRHLQAWDLGGGTTATPPPKNYILKPMGQTEELAIDQYSIDTSVDTGSTRYRHTIVILDDSQLY